MEIVEHTTIFPRNKYHCKENRIFDQDNKIIHSAPLCEYVHYCDGCWYHITKRFKDNYRQIYLIKDGEIIEKLLDKDYLFNTQIGIHYRDKFDPRFVVRNQNLYYSETLTKVAFNVNLNVNYFCASEDLSKIVIFHFHAISFFRLQEGIYNFLGMSIYSFSEYCTRPCGWIEDLFYICSFNKILIYKDGNIYRSYNLIEEIIGCEYDNDEKFFVIVTRGILHRTLVYFMDLDLDIIFFRELTSTTPRNLFKAEIFDNKILLWGKNSEWLGSFEFISPLQEIKMGTNKLLEFYEKYREKIDENMSSAIEVTITHLKNRFK